MAILPKPRLPLSMTVVAVWVRVVHHAKALRCNGALTMAACGLAVRPHKPQILMRLDWPEVIITAPIWLVELNVVLVEFGEHVVILALGRATDLLRMVEEGPWTVEDPEDRM
eukprot:9476581-Pyramimonas_sp.AAC.5